MDESAIYCPKCAWRPQGAERWMCALECDTVCNTFWTRGMCPGCARQWHQTQCLACRERSAHRDWYHVPRGERRDRERQVAKAA